MRRQDISHIKPEVKELNTLSDNDVKKLCELMQQYPRLLNSFNSLSGMEVSPSVDQIENVIQQGYQFLNDFEIPITKLIKANLQELDKTPIEEYIDIYSKCLLTLIDSMRDISEFDCLERKKAIIIQALNVGLSTNIILILSEAFHFYGYHFHHIDSLVLSSSILNKVNFSQIVNQAKVKKTIKRRMISLCVDYISIKLSYFKGDELNKWEQYVKDEGLENKSLTEFFEFLTREYFSLAFSRCQWSSVILAYEVITQMLNKFDFIKNTLYLNEETINKFNKEIQAYRDQALTKQQEETEEELDRRISDLSQYKNDNSCDAMRCMASYLNHELPFLKTKIDSDVIKKHINESIQLYYDQLIRYIHITIKSKIDIINLSVKEQQEAIKEIHDEIIHNMAAAYLRETQSKGFVSNQLIQCCKAISNNQDELIHVDYYELLSFVYKEIFGIYVSRRKINVDWDKIQNNIITAAHKLEKISKEQYGNPDQVNSALLLSLIWYVYPSIMKNIKLSNIKPRQYFDLCFNVLANVILDNVKWGTLLNYFCNQIYLYGMESEVTIDKFIDSISRLLPNIQMSQDLINKLKIKNLEKTIDRKKENFSKKIETISNKVKKYRQIKQDFEEELKKFDKEKLMEGFDPEQIPKSLSECFQTLQKSYDSCNRRIRGTEFISDETCDGKMQSLNELLNHNRTTSLLTTLENKISELITFEKSHFNETTEYVSLYVSFNKALDKSFNEYNTMHGAYHKRLETFQKMKEESLVKIQVQAKKQEQVKRKEVEEVVTQAEVEHDVKNDKPTNNKKPQPQPTIKRRNKKDQKMQQKIASTMMPWEEEEIRMEEQRKAKEKEKEKVREEIREKAQQAINKINQEVSRKAEQTINQDAVLLSGADKNITSTDLDYLYSLHLKTLQNASDDEKNNVGMYLKGSFVLHLLLKKFNDNPEIASKILVKDIDCHFLYHNKLDVERLVKEEGWVPTPGSKTKPTNKFSNYIKLPVNQENVEFDMTVETAPGYQSHPVAPIQSCYAKFVTAEEAKDPNRDCIQVGEYYFELVIPLEYRETIINTCKGAEFSLFSPRYGQHKNYGYMANKLFTKLKNAFPSLFAHVKSAESNDNFVSYIEAIESLKEYYFNGFSKAAFNPKKEEKVYSDLIKFCGYDISEDEVYFVKMIFKQFFSAYLKYLNMECDSAAEKAASEYLEFVLNASKTKQHYKREELVTTVRDLLEKYREVARQAIDDAETARAHQKILAEQAEVAGTYEHTWPEKTEADYAAGIAKAREAAARIQSEYVAKMQAEEAARMRTEETSRTQFEYARYHPRFFQETEQEFYGRGRGSPSNRHMPVGGELNKDYRGRGQGNLSERGRANVSYRGRRGFQQYKEHGESTRADILPNGTEKNTTGYTK